MNKKNLLFILTTIILTFLFNTLNYINLIEDKNYISKIIILDENIVITNLNRKKLKEKINIKNIKNWENGLYTSNIKIKNNKIISISIINETIQSKLYKKITNFFSYSLKNTNIKNLYLLLIWGNKKYISKKFIFLLNDIGILYFFVISGLHYNILKKYLYKIFNLFNLNKYIFQIIIFFILTFFTYILYGSPYQQSNYSISRCYIMYFIWFMNYMLKEAYDINKSFKLSIIYTIITNFYNIKNTSLLLTYIITFNILICNKLLKKEKIPIKKYLLFNIYIFLLNIPVTIYFFKKIFIYQILNNIIFSIIIYILFITFLIFSIIKLFNIYYLILTINYLLDIFYSFFIHLLYYFTKIPYSHINIHLNTYVLIFLYLIIIYFLNYFKT